MPEQIRRRADRAQAFPTRARARALSRVLAAMLVALAAAPAGAGPGSGSAIIVPTSAVPAGSYGIWTVQYVASEDFPISGGLIEVVIPSGWTPPQKTNSTSAGYVNWTDVNRVDSLTISGQTIRVHLGGADSVTDSSHRFLVGDAISVLYGVGGGPASARAQTTAPATAVYEVRSDPQGSGSPAPIASSPTLSVIPGPVASVRVVDATITAVGDLSRTTDDDTTHLYLRGYDSYGNSARFVEGTWSLTGGIGAPIPASGTGTVLALTTPGTGYAVGDSGAWSDSTGVITVARGAYGRIAFTAASSAVAGSPFAVTASATDADGNTITSGPGSNAAITFAAYADSVGSAAADPDLVASGATLSAGAYSGTLTPRRAGAFYFAAADSDSGFVSARSRVVVSPAAPDHMTLSPDTLRITAGSADTVSVRVFDVYGNRSPLSSPEVLTLWTDRPAGTFEDLSGAGIFEVTIGAGEDSTRVRFRDTQATGTPGRIRAIDANGLSPFLGSASARAIVTPAAPSGAIALTASPDTLTSNGVDSSIVVSSVVRDAYGNAVAQGERFTLGGALLAPVTDEDPAAPGAQLLADSAGALRGAVRAGTLRGLGSVTVVSERGSASGATSILLLSRVSATQTLVTATSPAVVGPAGSTIAVTLRDGQGQPLAGVPSDSISVEVTGAAASVAALASATDASGLIEYRATATVADTGTVLSAALGVAIASQPQVIFEPGPLDHYAVSGPSGPLTAGTGIALSVTAHDSFGNALGGRSGDVLRPAVTAGGAAVPDSVLLAGGAASVAVLPTLASPLAVTVVDDSSRSVTYGPVGVVPGAPYRALAIPAARDTLAAGDSIAIRALVSDAYSNAVAGAAVQASVVLGSGSIAPAGDDTDASGHADFTVHAGGVPGPLGIRVLAQASAAPESIRADTLSFTVVPGAAVSAVVSAPASGAAGDSLSVSITLLDSFGNRAVEATPALWLRTSTASPSPDHVTWIRGPLAQGSLVDSVGSDGAAYAFAPSDSGAVILLIRDTRAETVRVRASGPGIPLAQSGEIAVAAAPPDSVAIVSGDGQTGVVAQALAQPLRVRVRDAFGNPAPGAGVLFRVESGGGGIDVTAGGGIDSIAVSDGSGVAVCEVARLGTVSGAGSDRFRASVLIAPAASVSFVASASPDTASALEIAPGSLPLAPAQSATVTVTARDRFGNPAPAAPVTVYLGSPIRGALESLGATSGGPGSQSGITDGSGDLAVRYRAPSVAPAVDSIFARGPTIGPAGI
ncbi:MAG: hypothetical protein HY568_05425, partial [Candidatus Latescibacteria bacterium]|nr:hypothetical protein [Candidatus Latescibacterota bacterium]